MSENFSLTSDTSPSTPPNSRKRRSEGNIDPTRKKGKKTQPAGSKVCNRGGRKLARPRRKALHPRAAFYDSESELPGEESLGQTFSSARLLSAGNDDDSFAEKQCLPEVASHFVAAMALAARGVAEDGASDPSRSISQLFSSLQGIFRKERMEDDSLENLALRCIMAEETATCLDFVYMLNCIQLRCKVIG
jgi:hypothetical protein